MMLVSRKIIRRVALPSLIGAALCALVAEGSGLARALDAQLLSAAFRLRAALTEPRPGPVIAVALRADAGGHHRRSREDLAGVLQLLAGLPEGRRPRAILVDVGLYQPPSLSQGPGDTSVEARILKAQAALGSVVHPYEMHLRGAAPIDDDALHALRPHTLPTTPLWVQAATGLRAAHPSLLGPLYEGAAAAGFANTQAADPRGGLGLFSAPLLIAYHPGADSPERLYPSLALAGAAVALCGAERPLSCLSVEGGRLLLGRPGEAPLSLDPARLPINYRGRFLLPREGAGDPPRAGSSAGDLLFFVPHATGGALVDAFGISAGPVDLGGKSLVILDRQERPAVDNPLGARLLPGAVHAQALSNLLEGDLLHPWPPWSGLPLAAALVILAVLLRMRRRPTAGGSRARLLGPRGPAALYARDLLTAPEVALGAATALAGLGALTLFDRVIPATAPAAALTGSLLGWRLWLPRQLRRDGAAIRRLLDARRHQLGVLWQIREDLTDAVGAQEQLREDVQQLVEESLVGLNRVIEGGEGPPFSQLPSPEVYRTLGLAAPDVQAIAAAAAEAHDGVSGLRRIAATLDGLRAPEIGVALLREQRAAYESLLTHYRRLIHQAEAALAPLDQLAAAPPPAPPQGAEAADQLGMVIADGALARRLLRDVQLASRMDLPVLILGEPGVGKSRLAEAIHAASAAGGARAPAMVTVNCGALAEGLLEAELFGSVPGAYTHARDKAGVFEQAHGSTLFMDEIGELPLSLQPKLLRVVESGRVRRLGDTRERSFQVRLICATNRDLEAMTRDGQFRADLFERLRGPIIRLPPLRERQGDVRALCEAFFARQRADHGQGELTLPPTILQALERRRWAGNVRQLKTYVTVLCQLAFARAERGAGARAVTVEDLLLADEITGLAPPPPAPREEPAPEEGGPQAEVAVFGVDRAQRLEVYRRCDFQWRHVREEPGYARKHSTFNYDRWRNMVDAVLATGGELEAALEQILGDDCSPRAARREGGHLLSRWRELLDEARRRGAISEGRRGIDPSGLERLRGWLAMKLADQGVEERAVELVRLTQRGDLPWPPGMEPGGGAP